MKKKVKFDYYFFATELLLTVLYIQVEDKKLVRVGNLDFQEARVGET